MIEEPVHLLAHCEDCQKSYRVPDSGRIYRCKACGGVVRCKAADESLEEPLLANMVVCEECQVVQPVDEVECVECGATLPVGDEDDPAKRRHATVIALKDAGKWAEVVTWLYRLGATAYILAMVLSIVALKFTDVPLGEGLIVVAVTTGMAILMEMGALHMQFKPLPWSVGIAAAATVVTVVHLVGPNPLGVALGATGTLAIFAWGAVYPSRQFGVLISEHRDLYILHHSSSSTRRSLTGRTPEERHERLLRAMRRAARKAWKLSTIISVVLCIISATGTFAVVSQLRPNDFSTALEEFERSWKASDYEAISAQFTERVAKQQSAWLRGSANGFGWEDALPALEQVDLDLDAVNAVVKYQVDGHPVTANWILKGKEWKLTLLELPKPSLDPHLRRFLKAWSKSDANTIVGFFSEDNQAEFMKSFKAAIERRRWNPLPEIGEVVVEDEDEQGIVVLLRIEEGDVTTKWHLRPDATWGLHGLLFSKP